MAFLSFNEMKMVCISFIPSLTPLNRKRMHFALAMCDEEPDEFKYILHQVLHKVLWDIPEAVELGFKPFIQTKFAERVGALAYHEANSDECSPNCRLCLLKEGIF